MKQSFLSLLWAAIFAGLMYLLTWNVWITVGAFFIVLHICFFSLCMVYCEDYREKFLTPLMYGAGLIIIGGLGVAIIGAVFVAFFVGAPLFFVIKGKEDVI